jgi:hypothetical protein
VNNHKRSYTIIDEYSLRGEKTSLLETKSEGKILFYRYSEKRLSFLYSLHKEDRVPDEMILEICRYSE